MARENARQSRWAASFFGRKQNQSNAGAFGPNDAFLAAKAQLKNKRKCALRGRRQGTNQKRSTGCASARTCNTIHEMALKERRVNQSGQMEMGAYCLNLVRSLLIPTTFETPDIASSFTCMQSRREQQDRALQQQERMRRRRQQQQQQLLLLLLQKQKQKRKGKRRTTGCAPRTRSLYTRCGSLTMRQISPLAGKSECGSSMRTCDGASGERRDSRSFDRAKNEDGGKRALRRRGGPTGFSDTFSGTFLSAICRLNTSPSSSNSCRVAPLSFTFSE